MDTPVALFIFNRPKKTRRVLNQIAKVEPSRLLVVADGPRNDHPEDPERCEAVRTVINEQVNWGCDLRRKYADSNLGLRNRFATGLKWIFKQEREAIILEDDCLPNESFFRFCDEMLEKYRDDKRIMDISGTNHLEKWKSNEQDYHFSFNGGIWGWATWRRAWELYDPGMELWGNNEARKRLKDVIVDDNQFGYLEYIYNKTYTGEINTWDYQWGFARQINSALSIIPSKNLVSNIGFGEAATNTTREDSGISNIPRHEMGFPVDHPKYVAVDRGYDRAIHKTRPLSTRSRFLRWGRKIYNHLIL
jgi:hypothetical protein